MALRKETINALVRAISVPPDERTSVIVHGFDQFGNDITETLLVPTDGSVATTNNVFYGEQTKAAPNALGKRDAALESSLDDGLGQTAANG